MSSADTPPFTEQSDRAAAKPSGADTPAAAEDLATFSALADPAKIAGQQPAAEADQQLVVARLRAELQRRAQQVERMNHDRDPEATPAAAGEPVPGAEGWKPVGGAKPKPAEPAEKSAASEATLKRLLHAAHRKRHDLLKRMHERDSELAGVRREKTELAEALDEARSELAGALGERERVDELMADLTTRSAASERLSDECDSLRHALVEAQREAAEARSASERHREVLAETRHRVAEREAEASALRSALATNQKQAQAQDCDNQELKTALSIASETLEARRAELRQVRAELEATGRRLSESELEGHRLQNELEAQQQHASQQRNELVRLNEVVPRLEGELQERNHEAETLRQRLTAQRGELADAQEAISRSRRQCDGLTDELQNERQAHGRARERVAAHESTEAKLREILASIGKAASVLPRTEASHAEAPAPVANARAIEPHETPRAAAQNEPAEVAEVDEPAEMQTRQAPLDEGGGDAVEETESEVHALKANDSGSLLHFVAASRRPTRPAIFAAWRDQQVARKLASLEIDDTDGFFAHHVAAARPLAGDDKIEVLSLGGESPDFELGIARALRKNEQLAFRLYFPQRDAEHASELLRRAAGAGIHSELVAFDPSDWAAARLPEHFHAILGDGALARSDELDAFLEALERATRNGSRLALAERIGRGESRSAREMGDRVWSLMPERYKLNHVTGEVDDHYVGDGPATAETDILARLRGRFAFEDFASFGHLVDRFIGPEIGPNFDPEDERDRRFIDQIANLDEAKLDSGALSPVHMIARLSPIDDDA